MRPIGTHPGLLLPVVACLWLATLYGLRFGLMEIEPAADPCLAVPGGLLCQGRAALGLAIHFQVFGLAALATAGLAWFAPKHLRRAVATVALLLALPALVLYNVGYGAPATVLALLSLADAGLFRATARTSA